MKKQAVKLKNIFSGDIVLCSDIKETIQTDDKTFIRVFKEGNPNRTFLVNREAFVVAK